MVFKPIILSILFLSTFGLKITSIQDPHTSRTLIQDLESALKDDHFFGSLKEVDKLGQGTYGLVIKMNESGKFRDPTSIAVKISKDTNIDAIPDQIDEEVLTKDSGDISNKLANFRFLNYLQSKHTTRFLPFSFGDRNVLTTGKSGHLEIVNLWAMELADLGNLDEFINGISGFDDKLRFSINKRFEKKRFFFINLLYKTLYGANAFLNQQVMQGDIKPINIFVRTCDMLYKGDVCPIIGDWDLGYFYSPKFVENFMSYTANYRPPEFFYFSAEYGSSERNRMFVGDDAFKYSKKEDVYAIGATFIKMAQNLNFELQEKIPKTNDKINDSQLEGFQELLQSMVSPFTIKEVLAFQSAVVHQNEKSFYAHLKSAFFENLDSNYVASTQQFDKCIQPLKMKNIKAGNRIERYMNEAATKNYNPAILYLRLKNFFNVEIAGDKEKLKEYQSERTIFRGCEHFMKNSNPLEGIIEKRSTMADALTFAKNLFANELELQRIEVSDLDLVNLPQETHLDHKILKSNRNDIFIAPSFKSASNRVKLEFCTNMPTNEFEDLKKSVTKDETQKDFDILNGSVRDICKAIIRESLPRSVGSKLTLPLISNVKDVKAPIPSKAGVPRANSMSYAEVHQEEAVFQIPNKNTSGDFLPPTEKINHQIQRLDDKLNDVSNLGLLAVRNNSYLPPREQKQSVTARQKDANENDIAFNGKRNIMGQRISEMPKMTLDIGNVNLGVLRALHKEPTKYGGSSSNFQSRLPQRGGRVDLGNAGQASNAIRLVNMGNADIERNVRNINNILNAGANKRFKQDII